MASPMVVYFAGVKARLSFSMFENLFYSVTKPLPAWYLIGHMDGNEWIGASRCLWPVYRPVTLHPGDEVHSLVGGVFVVTREKKVLSTVSVLSAPVVISMMIHGSARDKRPIGEIAQDYLRPISEREAMKVKYFRPTGRPVVSFERGLEFTISAVADPSRRRRPGCKARFRRAFRYRSVGDKACLRIGLISIQMKTSTLPVRKRRVRRLPFASEVMDFRVGIDTVVHENGRCFVRDTQGLYADREVQSDILDATELASFENTAPDKINLKAQAVRLSALLTPEGRKQRIEALAAAWRKHFGDALFVVVS